MSSLGPDRKRLRQLTLPLRATNILPVGGAVIAPSTEGAPMQAPTDEDVARATAAALAPEGARRPSRRGHGETPPPIAEKNNQVHGARHGECVHAQYREVLHDSLWGAHLRTSTRRRRALDDALHAEPCTSRRGCR